MPLIGHYGYLAIFLVEFVESLGVPSPSEITLVAAGALVARGQLPYVPVVLVAALGSTLGAAVAYTLARRAGREVVLRYGRRVGLTPERLARAEDWFARYGVLAVVLGRVVSGVRAVISYPAGLLGMRRGAFLLATAAGALLWPLLAVTAGATAASQPVVHFVRSHQGQVGILLGGLLVVAGAVAWRRLRRRSQAR